MSPVTEVVLRGKLSVDRETGEIEVDGCDISLYLQSLCGKEIEMWVEEQKD